MPGESRAFRREIAAGCLVAALGFFGIAAAIIYLCHRYLVPANGWRGFADGVRYLLEYPLLGGALLGAATMTLLNRWHHFRGFYRCNFCGRSLRRRVPCACLPPEYQRTTVKGARWRYHRRHVLPVLLTYLVLLAPAGLIVTLRHGQEPFIIDLVILHAMFCLMFALAVEVALAVAELLNRARETRKRWRIFRQLFALYPLVVSVGGLAYSIRGHFG